MEAQSNVPLWRYTTLKIGGEAASFYQPESIDELVELMETLKKQGQPWFVLGGGSNLLVSSKGVEGSVIRTAHMKRMENPEPNVIVADAGARLPHLARFAASKGLSGFEFSVGIPGTVGGGVIMNAGAHGSCMSNLIETVTIFDTEKEEIITLANDEIGFVYRRCNLDPAKHVVLSARFRLTDERPDVIEANIKHNEEYRWKTQPLGWPNAGSTFKNPEPTRGAGLLLDQSGAKQLKEGNAAVSAVHANFVINMGGATSDEVTTLLRRMQDTVYDNFDIRLHPEWKIVGDFTNSEREVFES
ncbi:MAG: UDP-N-acetylmuramate dehydrogenase [Candidatus Obscuribacterales bacterium]|nr:UDP-N-acetylmuramate dehydrogenase [Cyanobacteria bacterium SZAS LIN-5]RTL45264.1 MAG: UDP-N-acetylmuramate dehydrogenase [Candidatus Melainabacteria bacterium]